MGFTYALRGAILLNITQRRHSYIDFESFDDGEIAIYRRRDNKVLILAHGTAGYVIRSARTSNRDDAYAFAKELRDDLKFRHRMGENVKSRQAKTVISEYLKSQTSHSRFENTQVTIGKHFNAFVGNKTMDAIDAALIEDYFEERKKAERYGRKLASSTLNGEGGDKKVPEMGDRNTYKGSQISKSSASSPSV